MASFEASRRESRVFALLGCVAVVIAFYLAKDILLPFALAILLCFLLAPFVARLERWRFPRILAVLLVVAVAFSGLGMLVSIVGNELYEVANHLPEYKANILNKAATFRGGGDGVFKKVTDLVADVREAPSPEGAMPARDKTDEAATDDEQADRPLRVEVVDQVSADEITRSVLGPILSPLGTAAIVLVLVVFMLLKREDLRNRLIHLFGAGRLNVTTQALDNAGSRLSRFLVMQLLINSTYGLVIAIGLYFIGLPNPLLWGALTTVLRFVPFVGPWIAAVIPIAISLAIFDGWTRPLLVLGLFLLNELVSNNILEPWLYGASTGISSIGILFSAAFWTWLWGPVGLVMATPLTVCLTTLGRYVPQLTFLHTLLSDEEALSPDERFYQRLLALDAEEAVDVAEEFLEHNSLELLYDAVLLPALSLAERDRHQGDLDESKERLILDTMRELVDDLGGRLTRDLAAEGEVHQTELTSANMGVRSEPAVLCLPARDEADEIAGLMLGQLFEARGVTARVLSIKVPASELLTLVADQPNGIICISAVPPFATIHARNLARRLRPKFSQLQIFVGLWHMRGSTKKTEERLAVAGVTRFVTTLAAAVEQVVNLAASPPSNSAAKPDETLATRRPAPKPVGNGLEPIFRVAGDPQ